MPAPTAVYQCTISGILGGQFVQSVFNFGLDSSSAASSYSVAVGIAEALETEGWMISFLNCLPEDYHITSVRCKKITSPGGPTAVKLASFYSATNGQRTGQISSAQVAPLVIWIAETESDLVGKTFMPGVSEEDIQDMLLESTLVDAIDLFIAQHIAPMTITANTVHGVVFRRDGAIGDWIQYGRLSPLIGTIRKRLRPV